MVASPGNIGQWTCGLKKLEWDSKHWGFDVGTIDPFITPLKNASLDAGMAVIHNCIDEAAKRGYKHLCVTADCKDTTAQICLQKAGFIMMDTLITHKLDLQLSSQTGGFDPQVRFAQLSDLEYLSMISAQCFGNRKNNINRFNSDPIFSTDKVELLYVTWVQRSLSKELADEVLVFEEKGEPVGFITISLPQSEEIPACISLNAVHPYHQNKGIYTRLVKAAITWLKERKVSVVIIKTQLTSLRVHRVWSKLGSCLTHAVHRFHYNF